MRSSPVGRRVALVAALVALWASPTLAADTRADHPVPPPRHPQPPDLQLFHSGEGLQVTGQALHGVGFACLFFGGTFALVGAIEGDPGFSQAGGVLNQIAFGSLTLGTPFLSAGSITSSVGLQRAGYRSAPVAGVVSTSGVALATVGYAGVAGQQIDTSGEWLSAGMLLLGVFVNQSMVSLQRRTDRGSRVEVRRDERARRRGEVYWAPTAAEGAAGVVVAGSF